jgi:hypothetical protein
VWRDPLHFYRHQPAQPAALLSLLLFALGGAAGLSLS